MENQHRQIKGYRELNEAEIALMNEIKTKGAELGELVQKLRPSQVPRERLCNNQRESAYAFSAWLASEYEDISLDDDDTVRQQMEHAWREAMKVANNEVTE